MRASLQTSRSCTTPWTGSQSKAVRSSPTIRPAGQPEPARSRAHLRPRGRVQRPASRQRPACHRGRGSPGARSSRSTSGTTSGRSTRCPGKTGFAHLFEHVMFQGSRHVAKAEHIALVQAAGGTMNGSTWLDRTNYFETLPAHQLDLALWLEADRMATLLDALSQENLDNQREVVKNEKRWSYDNRPYGSCQEKLQAPPLPARAPLPPLDDRVDGRPRRGVDRGRQRVLPDLLRAQQRGPLGRRRRRDGRCAGRRRTLLRRHPGRTRTSRALGDLSLPPTLGGERREIVFDKVPLPRVHVGFRAPVFGDPRLDALDLAGQILSGGKGSRLNRRLVRDERIAQDVAMFTLGFVGGASVTRRLGDGPAGRLGRARRGGAPRGAGAAGHRARERRRAGPRQGPDRGRRARRAPARRGAGRPALDVRDAVRRSRADQPDAAALSGGDARGDPRRRGGRLPAGQPGRPDLPARGHAGGRRHPPDRRGRRRRRATRRWPHEHHRRSEARRTGRSPSARSPGAPRPYDFPAVTGAPAGERPVDPRRRPAGPAARLGVDGRHRRRRRGAAPSRPGRPSWPPAR